VSIFLRVAPGIVHTGARTGSQQLLATHHPDDGDRGALARHGRPVQGPHREHTRRQIPGVAIRQARSHSAPRQRFTAGRLHGRRSGAPSNPPHPRLSCVCLPLEERRLWAASVSSPSHETSCRTASLAGAAAVQVTGVLKAYLMGVKEPVLPLRTQRQLLLVPLQTAPLSRQLAEVRAVLRELPPPAFATAALLLPLLQRVAAVSASFAVRGARIGNGCPGTSAQLAALLSPMLLRRRVQVPRPIGS
jgi:hypothetical protein